MSDVRVSSGSPSVERMEARQPEQHPKTSACRILFGLYDRQELRRDLERQGREIEVSFQQRWNFDPRLEKPLPGKMDWQAVPSGEVPGYYSRPCAKKSSLEPELDVNGNCARLAGGSAEDLGGNGRTDSAHQCCPPRKRPSTEDASSPNKKNNKTETNDDPVGSSVEQTPSKSNPRHQT